MGTDIPDISRIIHLGVPSTIESRYPLNFRSDLSSQNFKVLLQMYTLIEIHRIQALSMGTDIPDISHIIHLGVPSTIESGYPFNFWSDLNSQNVTFLLPMYTLIEIHRKQPNEPVIASLISQPMSKRLVEVVGMDNHVRQLCTGPTVTLGKILTRLTK